MRKSLFIVIEGIDGSGTTTCGKELVKELSANAVSAYFTCEPTNSKIGKLLRKALGGEGVGVFGKEIDSKTASLLFAADRHDHYANEIKPRLENKTVVICDRYLYSSLAYQGKDCSQRWIEEINCTVPEPDLVFFIDVDYETSLKRRIQRKSKEEIYENEKFQRDLIERYRTICEEKYSIFIDGSQSIEKVKNSCLEVIMKKIM